MSTQSGMETEVKLSLSGDLDSVRTRINALGFAVSIPREFESNTVYDNSTGGLRQAGMLLRLRQTGIKNVITWKGPGVPGPHKSRPEIETGVGSVEQLDQILRQLGYLPAFRYEKYRTTFAHAAGPGSIVLDETPIGNFLELEGPGAWIDETAQRLGFGTSDYLLESYARLYVSYCAQQGLTPENMVFGEAVL